MLAPERRSMPLRPGLYDLDGYLNTTFSLNGQVCGGDWLDDAGDLNTVNSLKTWLGFSILVTAATIRACASNCLRQRGCSGEPFVGEIETASVR